ncbi:hypothetical protein VNO77_22228 [Canavalia gladiata]|uniref:Uncharacterized protein n=1 Tax=Canavalia gladiata TaxID=3824 RepID=A0AAN9L4S7_CANGL
MGEFYTQWPPSDSYPTNTMKSQPHDDDVTWILILSKYDGASCRLSVDQLSPGTRELAFIILNTSAY